MGDSQSKSPDCASSRDKRELTTTKLSAQRSGSGRRSVRQPPVSEQSPVGLLKEGFGRTFRIPHLIAQNISEVSATFSCLAFLFFEKSMERIICQCNRFQ